jgi:hypothetical protein
MIANMTIRNARSSLPTRGGMCALRGQSLSHRHFDEAIAILKKYGRAAAVANLRETPQQSAPLWIEVSGFGEPRRVRTRTLLVTRNDVARSVTVL